jgi:hypothetical protein
MDGAAGQPGRGADLHAVQLFGGVGEQGVQDELGGDGHPGCPLLFHACSLPSPRLNTSYFMRRGIKYSPPS